MASSQPKRVAIVTGAAMGIGRAIAYRLAKDGLDLGVFDLPQCRELLDGFAADVNREFGTRVVVVIGDVSVEEDVKRLVDTVVLELGGLYAMIANAGIWRGSLLHEMPLEEVDKLINVNLKGVFFCYKYAAIRLIHQGHGGRIIGAASTASKRGSDRDGIYCATKFGVRGMSQCAAIEYGKYGITVNTYSPGSTLTPLLDKVCETITSQTGMSKEEWKKTMPNLLGRDGQPEDVANLVSFLASDDAAFITGRSYTVDGGMMLAKL